MSEGHKHAEEKPVLLKRALHAHVCCLEGTARFVLSQQWLKKSMRQLPRTQPVPCHLFGGFQHREPAMLPGCRLLWRTAGRPRAPRGVEEEGCRGGAGLRSGRLPIVGRRLLLGAGFLVGNSTPHAYVFQQCLERLGNKRYQAVSSGIKRYQAVSSGIKRCSGNPVDGEHQFANSKTTGLKRILVACLSMFRQSTIGWRSLLTDQVVLWLEHDRTNGGGSVKKDCTLVAYVTSGPRTYVYERTCFMKAKPNEIDLELQIQVDTSKLETRVGHSLLAVKALKTSQIRSPESGLLKAQRQNLPAWRVGRLGAARGVPALVERGGHCARLLLRVPGLRFLLKECPTFPWGKPSGFASKLAGFPLFPVATPKRAPSKKDTLK